jgi:hypothetical protein
MAKEQIREKIAGILGWESSLYNLKKADEILALDGIEIKSDDQSLPEITEEKPQLGTIGETLYLKQEVKLKRQTQRDMLKAGFIKCLPKRRE